MLPDRHVHADPAAEERSVVSTLLVSARRAVRVVGGAVLLSAVLSVLALPIADAQAQASESISGRLTFEGEPVAAVRISVADPASGATFEALSDGDGRWRVELPPGTYTVTIDTATLPEGIALRDPERTSL